MKRVEPHNPIICGLFSFFFGLDMMVSDRSSFTSGSYKVTFDLMPKWIWGILFIVSGAVLLWRRSPLGAGLCLGTFTAWTAALVSAKLLGYSTSSFQGIFIWLSIICMLWLSLRRFGSGVR